MYCRVDNSYFFFSQSDGSDEEMKDDIDSVRGLLDRFKEDKERELLKEVTCTIWPFLWNNTSYLK